ncbi:MAG: HAMP domain-containing protein [Parvicella sp.]
MLGIAAIDPRQIVDVAKSISFGQGGHAAIVDHTGKLLAHPFEAWRQEMKDLSKLSVVQDMLEGKTGITTFYSPAMKADMIAGHTSVPKTGWGVMVPQPLAELEQQASSVKDLLLDLIAPSLLISGLISWLLSAFLINPINSVVNAAKKMQSGNLSARVDAPNTLTPKELISLGESFNAMANDNQRAYDDLATTKLISDRAVSMLGPRGCHMGH